MNYHLLGEKRTEKNIWRFLLCFMHYSIFYKISWSWKFYISKIKHWNFLLLSSMNHYFILHSLICFLLNMNSLPSVEILCVRVPPMLWWRRHLYRLDDIIKSTYLFIPRIMRQHTQYDEAWLRRYRPHVSAIIYKLNK